MNRLTNGLQLDHMNFAKVFVYPCTGSFMGWHLRLICNEDLYSKKAYQSHKMATLLGHVHLAHLHSPIESHMVS